MKEQVTIDGDVAGRLHWSAPKAMTARELRAVVFFDDRGELPSTSEIDPLTPDGLSALVDALSRADHVELAVVLSECVDEGDGYLPAQRPLL